MKYNQFCPVAKASEMLGERWTFLIIRELLMGGSRFNELQQGLAQISPTILTKRLNELADYGLVVRKKIPAKKGYEYFLTQAGKELLPVIEQLGNWGMRWARDQLSESDYDVELLMVYLKRSIRPEKLVGNETVIKFHFTDLSKLNHWWILIQDQNIELCIKDPGRDVDVYFTTDLRTMVDYWMGDITLQQAKKDDQLKVVGETYLTRNIGSWLTPSFFAEVPRKAAATVL